LAANLSKTVLLVAFAWLAPSGCGYCQGALRDLPRATRFGEQTAPCVNGLECAEKVDASATFKHRGDCRGQVSNEDVLAQSKVSAESWFLLSDSGSVVPSDISAYNNQTAHTCNRACEFYLKPIEPLAPGHYRLVMLVDKTAWRWIGNVQYSEYNGQKAIVTYYEVR